MILISSTEVERKIAQNTFISWEKTKYLIFTVALYCISGPTYSITPSFGDNRTVFDTLITPIVYILIT